MRLTKAGFFALPDNEYFGDPAPHPSLTQSGVKLLLERSPLHFWHAHPRLNRDWRDERPERFDLGSVAHAILFGGRSMRMIDAPDWRTKAARELREEAIAVGQQPVLIPVYERAKRMTERFNRDITLLELDGSSEICALAEEEGTWLRTKIDWVSADHELLVDYKTTSTALKRDQVHAYAWHQGWHLQAAMQERILNILKPDALGRREHYFVLQEAYEPFATYKCRLSESVMQMGRHEVGKAVAIFRSCMAIGEWPGPSNDILAVTAPTWAVNEAIYGDGNGRAEHTD